MADAAKMDVVTIAHSMYSWLPRTQAWLLPVILNKPGNVHATVVCAIRENRNEFPLTQIRCFADDKHPRALYEKVLLRLGRGGFGDYLARAVRELNAEVIHSHFGTSGWADLQAAKSTGARHVVTFYGYDMSYLPSSSSEWRERYLELFGQVDRVICEGPFMAGRIERLGCPRHKIQVHHLGVDLSRIAFRPLTWTPGQPLRILMAATFTEKKGIPYGIKAIGLLKQRNIPIQLTLVGDAPPDAASQSEKKQILAAIQEYGLGSAVQLTGYLSYDKMMEIGYDHHIIMVPSVTASTGDSEGGAPMVIADMAASGRIIVGSTHADIPNVVIDGETGLLAPERDSQELAERIHWLFEHPEEWSRLVHQGRHRIETEFNAEIQGQRLHRIYADLLRNSAQ